jgi:hypothetical protein
VRFVREWILILAAVLLAGCGGGRPGSESISPQVLAAAPTSATSASLTSSAAADLLMDAAESGYPTLFPGHKSTQLFAPFAYRYYPETGMYVGVAITQNASYVLNGVYVVGAGFGTLTAPKYMGLVTDYVAVTISPPPGSVWEVALYPKSDFRDVQYLNGKFYAVNSAGFVVVSADGRTWDAKRTPAGQLSAITFANGMFVAVGFGNSIVTSTDGDTWVRASSSLADVAADYYGVAGGGGRFLAAGVGGVFGSLDGDT